MADVKAFHVAHPKADTKIPYAAGDWASQYVAAMAQHLIGVAALLDARHVTFSIWPIIRAELELAGRVGWLLDPGHGGHPLDSDARVARFFMEALADHRRHGIAEDPLVADIATVFPGAVLSGSQERDFRSWSLGSERFPAMTAAIRRFGELAFTNEPDLYNHFSRFSHPSWISLMAQTFRQSEGGIDRLFFEMTVSDLEDLVRIACAVFYKAAHLVSGYYGLSTESLETWARSAPAGWFTEEP